MNPALAAPRGPGLSGTALKRLACLSMLVDHLGASLLENGLFRCSAIDPRLVGLDQLCGWLGGWLFPSTVSYWWRAFSTPTISKNYACGCWASPSSARDPSTGPSSRASTGGIRMVYFTLLLGLLAMKALDTYQTPEGMPALKGILGAAACFLAAALLHCDYDVLGLGPHPRPLHDPEGQKSAVHRGRSFLPLRAGGTAGVRAGLVLQRRAGQQLQTRAVGVLLVLPCPYFRPRHPYKPPAFPINNRKL